MSSSFPTHRPENPLLHASLLSRLLFTWAYPLLHTGLQRPLQEYDLPHVDTVDSSAYGLALFQQVLASSSHHHHHVSYTLLKYYLRCLQWTQVKMCLYISAMVLQAVALGQCLNYFSTSTTSMYSACLWATVLIACAAMIILSTHSLYFDVWQMGMRLRIASVAAIFDKTLKLSSTTTSPSSTTTTMGQIVNVASNDSERFIMASVFGLYLIWGPIHALFVFIVGSILLRSVLPFIVGYTCLLLFAIVQFIMSQKFVYYRGIIASITDHRVHWISQLLLGIRVLKMHAWEDAMSHRLASIRTKEVEGIQRAVRLQAMNEAIFFASSILICLIIFGVHHALGGTLTLGTMYSIFALMNALQFTMVKYFSIAVMSCSECWVSVRRIVDFLSLSEMTVQSSAYTSQGNDTRDTLVISFREATCYWNHPGLSTPSENATALSSLCELSVTLVDESAQHEDEGFACKNIVALYSINLDVCRGELCCIIGPVGCGKSALIKAIVRELPLSFGDLNTSYRKLSYSAQDPWIMNASARENIVLGQDFEKGWYDQVVFSCGLDKDFQQFIYGDATIIGDRGVQISGGQRARISLARALYRDADLLILDDPLSAVDSKTGRLIYNHAIKSLAISRGKTVVLATHQHQFITDEKCVAMDHGKILLVGSYASCIERLQGIQGENVSFSQSDETTSGDIDDQPRGNVNDDIEEERNKTMPRKFNHSIIGAGDSLISGEVMDDKMGSPDDDHKESREKGGVTLSTWRHYERALGGRFVSIVIVFMMLLTQASLILAVAMTASWARRSQTQNAISRLKLALLFSAILIILSFIRSMFFFRQAINASKRLHDEMTYTVLRATILFFDTNPIGRILNRFSSDVGIADDNLPLTLFDFLATFTMVLGGLATAVYVLPPVLLSLPILLIFFLRSRKVFVCSSREIKRLEGLARSPIFDSIAESLSGVATIRTNDAVPYFRAKFEDAQNAHSRAFFAFIYSSRYLGVRIDCLMFAVIFISCYLAIILKETDWFHIDSVTIGLALSMILQMGEIAQWSTRQSAEVTNQMISVERLYQYSQLPSEAPLETPTDMLLGDAPHSWPSHGAIQVKNLCVRYRPSLPLSLIHITFDIKPAEHVAIVGRTGSGKSTLVQSFLRLLEAEDGQILIDGADISTLGLHRLRQSITVINQVPTLYGCVTVRDNLDPLGERSEEEIRQALIDVQMIHTVDQLDGGLDAMVSEGGGNFSVGQRALLGLARAILRRSKIVILDEPTANVDRETEGFIQEAVRKRFHDATMITIAHRLNTIIECDKVVVLGNGRLLEWGSPSQLLEVKGAFASLVDETGAETALQLRAKARNKENSFQNAATTSASA